MNNTYRFTLMLKNVDQDTLGLEDSLYQAGCDDALISFKNKAVFLDFDRQAPSFEKAVTSAIKNVESSSIGAIVVKLLTNKSEVRAIWPVKEVLPADLPDVLPKHKV